MKLVKLVHPGKTNGCIDTMYGTGVRWSHPGDVQEVADDAKALAMTKSSPAVYELVEHDPNPPKLKPAGLPDAKVGVLYETKVTLDDGSEVSLANAPRHDLARYADSIGLMVTEGHTRDDILRFIANLEEIRDPARNPSLGGAAAEVEARAQAERDQVAREAEERALREAEEGARGTGTGSLPPLDGAPPGGGPDPLEGLDTHFEA